MKRLISVFLSCLVCSFFRAQTPQQDAIKAYTEGDYSTAIKHYENILQGEGEAPALYYNLGNAYYKNKQIGKAILNYERALLLLPNYADARFNLELAKEQTVDKIEILPTFFLKRWMMNVQHFFSSDSWAILAFVLFVCFLGGMSLYFFMRKMLFRRIGFYVSIPALAFCIVSNVFAYREKKNYTQRGRAVIMQGSVSIKSTPDEGGTELFLLHEGTVVRIKNQIGEWEEIEIADGNVGWVEKKALERI